MTTGIKKLKALGISEERIKAFLAEAVSPSEGAEPSPVLNIKQEELEMERGHMVVEFLNQGTALHETEGWDWALQALKPIKEILQKIDSGELKYDPNRLTLYELIQEEGALLVSHGGTVGDLYDQRVEEINKYKEENGLEWVDLETEYKIYEKFVGMMKERVSKK